MEEWDPHLELKSVSRNGRRNEWDSGRESWNTCGDVPSALECEGPHNYNEEGRNIFKKANIISGDKQMQYF